MYEETPRSDAALEQFDKFTARVRERLVNGKRAYGDSSFERPLESLIEEIRQEALDVAGWGFIVFRRLDELDEKIQRAKNEVAVA